jgi:branched-chain amino acid transport system substrate-binding protein
MKKKIFLISLGLLLALLSMSWVGTGFTQPEIRIGVVAGYTGGHAVTSLAHQRGLELRLEQIGYKIAGRPVKVIYEDCKEEPGPTVSKVRKLIEDDRVHILLGPLLGSGIEAIAGYVKEKGVLWLPLAASGEHLTAANPMHFSEAHGWNQYGSYLAPYAYDKFGARTAVIIIHDYSFGHLMGRHFKTTFIKAGGEIVQEIALPLPELDYRPYLVKVKKADVALVFTTGFPAVRFVKQYVELGLQKRTPVFALGSSLDTLYRADMGADALGMRYIFQWDPDLDTPENIKFVRDLKKKYPMIKDTSFYEMNGFVSARIIEEALKAIKGDAENKARFAKAVAAVDFLAPQGRFRFHPEIRAPYVTYYVFEVVEKDGKFPSKVIDKIPDTSPVLPK